MSKSTVWLTCPLCGERISYHKDYKCSYCGLGIKLSNPKKIKYMDMKNVLILIEN
jgi:ribosomal protein L37E